jgi:FkbM family methyltransferase
MTVADGAMALGTNTFSSMFLKGYKTIVAEKLYSVFFRPKLIRGLVHWFLFKVIPKKVRIFDQFDLLLNPKDPVISGALTFGVYEPFEQIVFKTVCRSGFNVLDIGANVGLYTGIAASQVGPGGLVISIEPHPESFKFLTLTCAENHFTNVRPFNVAAGDAPRNVQLFLTDKNKGDSRIYDPTGTRAHIDTKMIVLDDLLKEQQIDRIDLIKMDIQGAEGLAVAGLRETLKKAKSLIVFSEFWPWGLLQTGVDPFDFLTTFQELGFSIFRIQEESCKVSEVNNLFAFASSFRVTEYTTPQMQLSHLNLIFAKTSEPVFQQFNSL